MLLDRLQKELETINQLPDQPFRLVVSTGVVVCPQDQNKHTFEDLLNRADTLMYQQKRERRKQDRQISFA